MDERLIEFGGLKNNFFRRNIYYKIDINFNRKLNSFKKKYNNTDIYNTLYTYDSLNIEDSSLLGPFYLDFDSLNIEEEYFIIRREVYQTIKYLKRIWGIPEYMIKLFFSGAKGFHIIVPYQTIGIIPDIELNFKYKKIAKLIAKECNLKHLDTSIYDKRRLFRIVNSINSKTGLYKIPLTLECLMQSNLNDIKQIAATPKEILYEDPIKIEKAFKYYTNLFRLSNKKVYSNKSNENKINYYNNELLPCIESILKNNVKQGKRNNTTVILASSLFQKRKTLKEVIDILQEWNKYNEPSLSEAELITTIASAQNMSNNNKYYGCNSIKNLDLCIKNKCPLYIK